MLLNLKCGHDAKHCALGLCSKCYKKRRRETYIPTSRLLDCGHFAPHQAKGKCRPCYVRDHGPAQCREYYSRNKDAILAKKSLENIAEPEKYSKYRRDWRNNNLALSKACARLSMERARRELRSYYLKAIFESKGAVLPEVMEAHYREYVFNKRIISKVKKELDQWQTA